MVLVVLLVGCCGVDMLADKTGIYSTLMEVLPRAVGLSNGAETFREAGRMGILNACSRVWYMEASTVYGARLSG